MLNLNRFIHVPSDGRGSDRKSILGDVSLWYS